jgi:hypothetical protein
MQYRLVWLLDGDEHVDLLPYETIDVPRKIRDFLQGIYPAMEVRIIEEPDEKTGNCNEEQEGKPVRQEG